jgi:hypothetical protein
MAMVGNASGNYRRKLTAADFDPFVDDAAEGAGRGQRITAKSFERFCRALESAAGKGGKRGRQ